MSGAWNDLGARGKPNEGTKRTHRVELRPAASYGRRATRWLKGWEGFFPLGMLSILVGYQGDGKTLVCCLMAANESRQGRKVVIATTEDEIESVLRPRLEAAGADLNLVSFVVLKNPDGSDEPLQLPDHGGLLVDAIEREKPSLFILDPMEAFLGVTVDSWKSPDMRRALKPISTAAERAGCAAIVVGYINRSASPVFLDRIAESMAFSRAARSAVLLWPDPDDPEGDQGSQRVLALGKTNIAPRGTRAKRYRIEQFTLSHVTASTENGLDDDLEQVTTARIVYTGESNHTANKLLAAAKKKDAISNEQSAAVREASELLVSSEILGKGEPVGAKDLFAVASEYGFTPANMRAAAKSINQEATDADEEPFVLISRRPEFQAGVEWRLTRPYTRARAGDIRSLNECERVKKSGNHAGSFTLSHSSPHFQAEIDLSDQASEPVQAVKKQAGESPTLRALDEDAAPRFESMPDDERDRFAPADARQLYDFKHQEPVNGKPPAGAADQDSLPPIDEAEHHLAEPVDWEAEADA